MAPFAVLRREDEVALEVSKCPAGMIGSRYQPEAAPGIIMTRTASTTLLSYRLVPQDELEPKCLRIALTRM